MVVAAVGKDASSELITVAVFAVACGTNVFVEIPSVAAVIVVAATSTAVVVSASVPFIEASVANEPCSATVVRIGIEITVVSTVLESSDKMDAVNVLTVPMSSMIVAGGVGEGLDGNRLGCTGVVESKT